ncbi:MAG: SDR family NAD(P)-dependent oxidoreductase [Patescibacteria group bacterium]|nr:SDR family NAD(P)-dependent oxidoreductase [Patescibacteria group bacterium]
MKTAFITGASRGLGCGFVEHLLEAGYQVFASVLRFSDKLPQQDNLTWITCDVSDDSSIQSAFDEVSKLTDHLDLVVSNAGISRRTFEDQGLVSELTSLNRDSLLKMFNVNSLGPIMVTKCFLPLLSGEEAWVINVSSIRAYFNDANTHGNYGYRASKVALNMFTRCSLFDLPENIRTFAVHPGSVESEMNPDGSQTPKEQAEKIISITQNWDDDLNGKFLNYDGTEFEQ